jgi:hypothetical protein
MGDHFGNALFVLPLADGRFLHQFGSLGKWCLPPGIEGFRSPEQGPFNILTGVRSEGLQYFFSTWIYRVHGFG